MSAAPNSKANATYLNPVYNHNCPDPFVLKFKGEYWAYCTGFWPDGRCFGILQSRDLVNWRELNGAMEPLPGHLPCYWAPEVIYDNGRFLMYYSVGNEERMNIRVAVAEQPDGPFIDSGRQLTTEEFAIDAHVHFENGQRYLFYATDFLKHTHIGTGTVCDRMLDAFTLAGDPHPVTRARYDWQVYDPHRIEKGGVRWHTVEGPFVLKRKNLYYQMFSGGNWKNLTYGVSYAVSDRIDRTEEWQQVADGMRVLPILRTLPGKVTGPGHNSVVRGPDNQQLFCIYHRWAGDESGRVLAIDRLDWAGERMLVLGPSTTPQPAPISPASVDFFEETYAEGLGAKWECAGEGRWFVRHGEAVQEATGVSTEAICPVRSTCFVTEVSLRALADPSGQGIYGLGLRGDNGSVLQIALVPSAKRVVALRPAGGEWIGVGEPVNLPGDFEPNAYHLLRIEANGSRLSVELDEGRVRWQGRVEFDPERIALLTRKMAAAFAGFAFTIGWEDLFMEPDGDPAAHGWQPRAGHENWSVDERQLWHGNIAGEHGLLVKGPLLDSYELVVNVRLDREAGTGGCYGFYPALDAEGSGPLLTVRRRDTGWALEMRAETGESGEARAFPLPEFFDASVYQQFRFRKEDGRLSIWWEEHVLGEFDILRAATRVGLYAHRAIAAFDMVRVTAI